MRCKAEISPERIQAFHEDALTEAEAKHLEKPRWVLRPGSDRPWMRKPPET